jgi:hypothetical protein
MAKDKKNTSQKPQIKFKKVNLKEIKFKKPNLGKMKEDVSKFTKNPKTRPILKIVGLVLIIVGSFALIDFGVQYLNNDYSVAVVSGTRISKSSWNRLLQQAYGQTAAQQLIDNEVITQEAKKQNITASTSEIQTQIDQIVTSLGGQTQYQAALKSNNITEAELKDEIRIDVLTTKLISPTITYTDDDIKSFFTEYSAQLFPTETAALASGAELDYDTYKDQTIQYYIQQQVSNTKSTWLSSKEASYKIQDNATTTPTYGLFQTTINIVKNIVSDIKGSK